MQATIFGLAGIMPFRYIAVAMLGCGLSGIVCNIVRTITLLAFSDSPKMSAYIFFFVAAFYCFICAAAYPCILAKNEFF
jgi:hypothetical protein